MSTQPRSGAGTPVGGAVGRRLVVANKLSELRRASEWVRALAHECRLAPEVAHDLELVVNEALTNIISYAYRDQAQHEIVIEFSIEPDRVRIDVEDDGVAFNPLEQPVDAPASLEKSKPTGRGIPLMRNFMDELHYLRRGDRNALTMVMRRAES